MKHTFIFVAVTLLSASLYFFSSESEVTQVSGNTEQLSKDDTLNEQKPSASLPLEVAQTQENTDVESKASSGVSQSVNTNQNGTVLQPDRFISEQSLDQSFIYPDNTLSRTSLNDFFLHPDFHQWVDNISAMQKSQASIEREIKLIEQLTNKLGGRVFGEEYACAGRICVVQFSYDASVSKEELSDLSEFDKNYVFMNYAADAGEGQQFRAIYIQTDDPSTLTIGD